MYKNQLQELAQRSCFNLPSYSCIREGPDHAPRFKASVNFNGEVFESPAFCNTLRQAEHSAAEVALHSLSSRAPSHSLAAKILDETGVYKNLLQEISQRVGARLPTYTTFRSGLGHLPVFTCTVELAGIIFTGEPAKNKKQAEKNAAMTAWSSLKKLAKQETSSSSLSETTVAESNDEQEQITIARALLRYRLKEKMVMAINPDVTANSPFPKKFPLQPENKPSSVHSTSSTGSKILPLIRQQSSPRTRPSYPATPIKFPGAGAGAAPYMPIRQYRPQRFNHCNTAAPVTMRTAVPVFASPPSQFQSINTSPLVRVAPPVQVRQAVPVFGARPFTVQVNQPLTPPPIKQEVTIASPPSTKQEVTVASPPSTKQEVTVASPPPTKQEVTVASPPPTKQEVTVASPPPTKQEVTVASPPPTKQEVTVASPPPTKQEVMVASPSLTNQEFPTTAVPQTEQSFPDPAAIPAPVTEQLSPLVATPIEATQQLSPPALPTEAETPEPEIISESTVSGDDSELTKSVVTNNLENLAI